MAYDMSRCPQTIEELEAYFYTIIARTKGTPCPDWRSVMTLSNIPHNVYTPGLKADSTWPMYGLTQQWSDGPKGRIFAPGPTADDNGYYTCAYQYLDDGPDGQLVWAWYPVPGAGSVYAPVQGATGGGTQPPVVIVPGGGLSPEEVQAMIDAAIDDALVPVYQALEQALQFGSKIALRTNSGLLAGIKGGGPTVADAPIEWIGKVGEAHSWESLTLEKGE